MTVDEATDEITRDHEKTAETDKTGGLGVSRFTIEDVVAQAQEAYIKKNGHEAEALSGPTARTCRNL